MYDEAINTLILNREVIVLAEGTNLPGLKSSAYRQLRMIGMNDSLYTTKLKVDGKLCYRLRLITHRVVIL